MKSLILCLVLFNIGLFVYFKYEASSAHLTHITLAPLQPEKLKILTEEEIKSLPKKAADASIAENAVPGSPPQAGGAAPTLASCYDWSGFSAKQVQRVSSLLDKHLLQYAVKSSDVNEDARYWIYIPPKASQEAAQAKVDELKRLGVEDSFIVQELPWRFAISFGVFKDEQLANKLLEDLKSHGVKTAIKSVRNQEKGNATFHITNMSPEVLDKLEQTDKIKTLYPTTELKEAACQ